MGACEAEAQSLQLFATIFASTEISMNKHYDIAICDACSLAGDALIRLFEKTALPAGNVYFLSDTAEKGATVELSGKEVDVLQAATFEFMDVDLVLIPVGAAISEWVIEQALAANCMVIDGSPGAAGHSGAVVALPGLNEEALDIAVVQKRLVVPASPAAMVLTTLQAINGVNMINRVDITACQSVSRHGNAGIDALRKQTIELLNGKPVDYGIFPQRIAYNLIPQVGALTPEGISAEELMVETEVWAGLNDGGIDVRATCIAAPVFYGDNLTVTLDLDSPVDIIAVRSALDAVNGIALYEGNEYPTVEQSVGNDNILLGRLRTLPGKEESLGFWVSGDSSYQGAIAVTTLAQRLIADFL